jgi:hypothetical protein
MSVAKMLLFRYGYIFVRISDSCSWLAPLAGPLYLDVLEQKDRLRAGKEVHAREHGQKAYRDKKEQVQAAFHAFRLAPFKISSTS